MHYSLQITQPILPAATFEEIQEIEELTLLEPLSIPQGRMESAKKTYVFLKECLLNTTQSVHSYLVQTGLKILNTYSPMTQVNQQLAKTKYIFPSIKGMIDSSPSHAKSFTKESLQPFERKTKEQEMDEISFKGGEQKRVIKMNRPGELSKLLSKQGSASQAKHINHNHTSHFQYQWMKKDTMQWWQDRYDQKERDGQSHDQNHSNPESENPVDKKKKKQAKIEAISIKHPDYNSEIYKEKKDMAMQKPRLEKPNTGLFALYYILTKIGIFSNNASSFSYKKEIESLDMETTRAHQKRLDEIKEALEKEKSTENWGIAVKIFSWITSLIGIIAGVTMIATGIGAVAGGMIVAGGLIQITNQILTITDGWKKISQILPGNDPDKKRAIISWMQIGIAVLCLILSGVGIAGGGYSHFSEATQTAMALFGGVISMGYGAVTIGEGITLFMFKNKLSEVKRYDQILAELKHKRQDLIEEGDWNIDRLEQLFKDLAKMLEFEAELFKSNQMINR
ncbi:MAG: type III secretion system translocon subunit SctE [Chlamydiales bacterium]